jgi:hypothetical protein
MSWLGAAAHAVDEESERDAVTRQQVGIALDVHRVVELGVESPDRLLGYACAAQNLEDVGLSAKIALAHRSRRHDDTLVVTEICFAAKGDRR